jgi:hypothetical protein
MLRKLLLLELLPWLLQSRQYPLQTPLPLLQALNSPRWDAFLLQRWWLLRVLLWVLWLR